MRKPEISCSTCGALPSETFAATVLASPHEHYSRTLAAWTVTRHSRTRIDQQAPLYERKAPSRRESSSRLPTDRLVKKFTSVAGPGWVHAGDQARAHRVLADEQIQALDREQPVLPMMPGIPERRTIPMSATAQPPCLQPSTSPPDL